MSIFPIAQSLAADLAGARVDPNEAQKALAYLRSRRSGKAFFSYLQAVVNNGQAVIRSRQTLDYYRALLQICERHLRPLQGDYKQMALALGWALRLLRYYRAVPEAVQEQVREQRPTPPPDRAAAPRREPPEAQTPDTKAVATADDVRPATAETFPPAAASAPGDAQAAPDTLPTPDALPPNTRITGQRAKQIERFTFQGSTIRGVRITPNARQISAPQGKELVLFVDDKQTGGGFGGVIVAIDHTQPKHLLVLMKATKKEA